MLLQNPGRRLPFLAMSLGPLMDATGLNGKIGPITR